MRWIWNFLFSAPALFIHLGILLERIPWRIAAEFYCLCSAFFFLQSQQNCSNAVWTIKTSGRKFRSKLKNPAKNEECLKTIPMEFNEHKCSHPVASNTKETSDKNTALAINYHMYTNTHFHRTLTLISW